MSNVCVGRNIQCLPVIDIPETGKKIKTLREKSGLSVKDVAEIFGTISPTAIYKWESGEHLPVVDNLVALAAIFETTIDEIVCIKE